MPKTGEASHQEVARMEADGVKLPVATGVMASAPGLERRGLKRLSLRHRPSGERVDPGVGGGVGVAGFGLGGVVSEASLPSIACSNPVRSVQKVPGPA
ncbi:MAG: hypothetical protein JO034_04510 [Singulisphaera sp.]|nr:hypothetical protein [Singulisphaera sp.]